MNDFLDSAVDLPDIELTPLTDGISYIAPPDAKTLAIKFGIIGSGQGGCVAGRTNIYVSDKGILPIGEFYTQMRNSADLTDILVAGGDVGILLKDTYTIGMNPETGKVVRAKVTAVWKNAARNHKNITFENNSELTCSASHPTFVFRPDSKNKIYAKSISDKSSPLQIDDRALDARNLVLDVSEGQNVNFRGVEIDADTGWLFGFFAGNGYAKKQENGNEISFYSDDETTIIKAKAILDKLSFVGCTTISDQPGCKKLCVSGLNTSIFFRSAFEFDGGKKSYTVRIPKCVSASSPTTRLAFLAGVIDSDTEIAARWCEAEICTASEMFADEMGCLCSTLGMRTVSSKRPPGKRGVVDTFHVSISGKTNFGPLFDQLISYVVHSKRKERLLIYAESDQKSFATSCSSIKFEEIKPWLIQAGYVNGCQVETKHGLNLKNWIRGERQLSLPTFNKLLNIFKNEKLDYVQQICPCLCKIKNIEDTEIEDSFYDLSVEGIENYFAGNKGFILTHNSKLADSMYQIGYRRVCAINTTAQDFLGLTLPVENQKVLKSKGGAGKDPAKGREALKDSQEEVLNLMRHTFGEDIERILICVSAGGGSGGGSALLLYKLARYYLQQLGRTEKVGMILTLPKKMEGGKVQANAYQLLSDLKLLVEAKEITPFILVDNESIHQMFPNATAKEFWPTANRNVVGLFDIFNVLACQKSQYATFDHEDYRTLLDSGTILFGATKLTQYEKDTDISDGLRNNLKRTLLAEADITSATHVAAILCAPDKILGVLPQSHIDLAFVTLERILSGENRDVMVHQGIYEAKRLGLYLYTMVWGVKIPDSRLDIMKSRSGMPEL
jgi:cell division GTPase FtsZ